jgi:hypothetical protein
VSDAGQTLMLDEWINVASPLAIMVLDRSGDLVAQYSFDDIVTVTGRTRADIVDQAEQGFWIAGEPFLGRNQQAAVPAAGGTLWINLETGQIRF